MKVDKLTKNSSKHQRYTKPHRPNNKIKKKKKKILIHLSTGCKRVLIYAFQLTIKRVVPKMGVKADQVPLNVAPESRVTQSPNERMRYLNGIPKEFGKNNI